MLLQHPQPQSTREQTLSSYANHLQQLSAHLDVRAQALQSSEARLAASQSDLSTHRHALNQLETRTRHHIAQLLRHIHQRQAALVSWERTSASAKKSMSKTLAAVDTLLSDARFAAANLNQIRAQHNHLQSLVTQGRAQLSEIQAQTEASSRSHASLKESIQNIVKDKQTIERSADKLQSLEATLRSREAQLNTREQSITRQKAHLQRLQPLEALSVPLQAFLDNAAAASLIDRISVETDIAGATDAAIIAMRRLQRAARDAQNARNDVSNSRQQLTARETRLKSRESDLNNKRQTLDREKSALQLRISEVSTSQSEISASWGAIEQARKETDVRDEQLCARETAIEQAELRIQHRETALSEREKTLARRERSIRRAHVAVTARERAVEVRERKIENDRTRLTDLRKAIDVREDMLETRDLELSAREADCGGRLEALLHRSLERPSSVQRAQREKSPSVSGTRKTRDDDKDGCATSEESPGQESAKEAPSTVRRQLAFFESSKDDADEDIDGGSEANRKTDELNVPDDESEAAAEQLLPELVGARSYWRERVERLERIVQSMRNKTWAIRPHVLPVLMSVAEGLLAIRREIDEFPRPNFNNSPKNAYLNEQACQIQWREQMKQHFDSVREIQAGLLIRLNREEEAATIQGNENQGEQSAGTSNTAESSVEATLDVTLTGDLTRDVLGMVGQGGEDVALSRPRYQKQVPAEGLLASPVLESSALLWSDEISGIEVGGGPLSPGTTAEENNTQQGADVTEEQAEEGQVEALPVEASFSAEAPDALGSDVLEELALLRDDLENVTTSQDSEIS